MTDSETQPEVDPEEVEVVRSGTEDELRKSSATRTVAREALFDEKKIKTREDGDEAPPRAIARMPEQLRHTAVEVPAKARLATLAGLLAGWMRGAVPKVMVFFRSSCESAEFHHRVLLAGGRAREERNGKTRDARSAYGVFRLHGVMSQSDRRLVYAGFCRNQGGRVVVHGRGARGLDFENVGATVQVDAPSDPETYVHRVGRAAPPRRRRRAVIFLAPRETEYASVLGELGVALRSRVRAGDAGRPGARAEDRRRREPKTERTPKPPTPKNAGARRKYERDPHLHPAAQRLQKRLHAEVARDAGLATLARDAFRAHVRIRHVPRVAEAHLPRQAPAPRPRRRAAKRAQGGARPDWQERDARAAAGGQGQKTQGRDAGEEGRQGEAQAPR